MASGITLSLAKCNFLKTTSLFPLVLVSKKGNSKLATEALAGQPVCVKGQNFWK